MPGVIVCFILLLMRFVLASDCVLEPEAHHCPPEVTNDRKHMGNHNEVAGGSSRVKRSLIPKLPFRHSNDVYGNKMMRWDSHYIRLREGDTLRLNCCKKMPPSRQEERDLLWWHNDMTINVLSARVVSHFPVLVIKSVTERDNGVYWTRHKNVAQRVVYSVTVYSDRPVVRRPFGRTIVFPCHSRAMSKIWGHVRFVWFHNGSTYQFTERHSSVDYKLVLPHPDLEANGRWQCVAVVLTTMTAFITNEGVFSIEPPLPDWHDVYRSVEKRVGFAMLTITVVATLSYFACRCVVFQVKKVGYRLILSKAAKKQKQSTKKERSL